MKELTKKILEAGLVDKHLAVMMERWGQLDAGASESVGKNQVATKEGLQAFADDIVDLVEADKPVKETLLDMEVSSPKIFMAAGENPFYGAWDKAGHLLLGTGVRLVQGSKVMEMLGDGKSKKYTVLTTSPVYIGEDIVGQLVTVEAL